MAGSKVSACLFGAGRLGPRIRAFAREIDGVRAGTDPECVHRMRVASRRLRSALPLFEDCFSKRKFRRWMRELKEITTALGSARDTDVQLAFLEGYERDPATGDCERVAVRRIRALLQERRALGQDQILSALGGLEDKDVVAQLEGAVKKIRKGEQAAGSKSRPGTEILSRAEIRITKVLQALLASDAAVRDPEDVQGHHALRIAAKKLRYTLEVFRPLYPDRFRPALAGIRHLQELLGQIHDCDVWIQLLSASPAGGNADSPRSGNGSPGGQLIADEEAGRALLLRNRRKARQDLYLQLVAEWETGATSSLPDRLRAAMGSVPVVTGTTAPPVRIAAAPALPYGEQAGSPALLYPEGAGHMQQVTRLSLQLFDELAPLHGYGKKERRLLEYAAGLHDIGWVHGQKGHHTSSFTLILADKTLPVTDRERLIIALIARYHRKELPDLSEKFFSGMKPKDRDRVQALSALLRIADGLDYTHTSRVQGLSCTLAPGVVTCVPSCDGDGGIERVRALQKSDLFKQVYKTGFEIP